jgi:hypothetical protein
MPVAEEEVIIIMVLPHLQDQQGELVVEVREVLVRKVLFPDLLLV